MAKTSRYPKVAPDAPLRALSDAVLRTLWEEICSQASGALAGDVDPVHDMRVAIRRFRSALRSFRRCYRGETRRPVAKGMRRLGRVMGSVRDADVHLGVLRPALQAAVSTEAAGVEFVIERVSEERGRALAEAQRAFASLHPAAVRRMLDDA